MILNKDAFHLVHNLFWHCLNFYEHTWCLQSERKKMKIIEIQNKNKSPWQTQSGIWHRSGLRTRSTEAGTEAQAGLRLVSSTERLPSGLQLSLGSFSPHRFLAFQDAAARTQFRARGHAWPGRTGRDGEICPLQESHILQRCIPSTFYPYKVPSSQGGSSRIAPLLYIK